MNHTKKGQKMNVYKNRFHDTEYKTSYDIDEILSRPDWERSEKEKKAVRRCYVALCGINGCTCGDDAGRR